MKKKLTRKEREREFKKHEILDAAIEIFAHKGFYSTTLDEIAEKSEFGKGTIYNYFANKEEIYKEIVSSIVENHKNTILKIDESTNCLYEFQLESFKKHFMFCLNNKDAFLLLVATKMNPAINHSIELNDILEKSEKEIINHLIIRLKESIERKEIRDLDLTKLLRFIKNSTFVYVYEILISENIKEEEIEKEAKFITDIIFNGIKY